MSKAEKTDALIDSAILSFARDGYSGASLREIASRAGLSLGTIHFYFGSKLELFLSASHKVWVEICRERDELILLVLADDEGGQPPLDGLIKALARPIVRRAMSTNETDRAQLYVIGIRVSEQESVEADRVVSHSLIRWVNALSRACPSLIRKDVMWAYCFINGVIWSWRTIDHRYDHVLGSDLERTADEVLDEIVAFASAGVRSMIERRTAHR